MASIDWESGKVNGRDASNQKGKTVGFMLIQDMRSTRPATMQHDRAWTLTPTKTQNGYGDEEEELDLRRVHPQGMSRQDVMSESPKRWDLLHQFVGNRSSRTKLSNRLESSSGRLFKKRSNTILNALSNHRSQR
jgi:hypothetical protein